MFLVGLVEYVQQRGLSVAAERIMPELNLTQMQIGWLEQAFVIGYALFQVPSAVFGQRWGARWTILGLGLASLLCILAMLLAARTLGAEPLFVVLLLIQVLFGVVQAPTFPVANGLFEAWFPARNWALVQGLQSMGLGLGGAIAPPLVATLMIAIGWQEALLWTGLLGIPIFLCWGWYGRNRPDEHPAIRRKECDVHRMPDTDTGGGRAAIGELRALLRDRHVLLLALSYLAMNYVYYLLGNWCFLYLIQVRHFSVLASGLYSIGPPLAAGIGAASGGGLATRLYARFQHRALYVCPLVALPLSGIALVLAVRADDAATAVGLLTASYFLIELTEGSFWAASMMLGRRQSTIVGGILNTGGSLGGVIGIPIVAYLSGHGAWNEAFLLGAAAAFTSATLWLLIDARMRPTGRPDRQSHTAAGSSLSPLVPTEA